MDCDHLLCQTSWQEGALILIKLFWVRENPFCAKSLHKLPLPFNLRAGKKQYLGPKLIIAKIINVFLKNF
jgi:hypothetical protein